VLPDTRTVRVLKTVCGGTRPGKRWSDQSESNRTLEGLEGPGLNPSVWTRKRKSRLGGRLDSGDTFPVRGGGRRLSSGRCSAKS
jgi:hypothetical protein